MQASWCTDDGNKLLTRHDRCTWWLRSVCMAAVTPTARNAREVAKVGDFIGYYKPASVSGEKKTDNACKLREAACLDGHLASQSHQID